jgi:hypothetical protein
MIQDLQDNFSPESGVNRWGGDVCGHAQSGLLTSTFHASRQLTREGEVDVFARPDQNEVVGWDLNETVVEGNRISQVDNIGKVDVVQIDVMTRMRGS